MECQHMNFEARANISRCQRSETDPTIMAYFCELTVRCTLCGAPFEFIGLPMGLSPGGPRCSVDGHEARLPIKPKGEVMPLDVVGYDVQFHQA
jgi:hypothetical protein